MGRHPVVAETARVEGRRDEGRPQRVHLHERREVPRVAEVVGVEPFVRLGHAAGSTAMTRISLWSRSARPMNGNEIPEKFEPPPVHPMTMSG